MSKRIRVRWLFDDRGVRAAWVAWTIVFLGFTVVTFAKPDFRSVTSAYRSASHNWLAGRDIYPQREGEMNYLPQFAALFSPFAMLPKRLGDTLWRGLQMAVFVTAIRRLATVARRGGVDLFPLASFLVLPAALSSIMNGQSNLLLAGAMAHAAVECVNDKRLPAVAWLMAGVVAKPIAIVMALLLAATDVAMLPWLIGGATITAVLPWLFDSWSTVAETYGSWFQQMVLIAPSSEPRFEDIAGLVRVLNVHPDPALLFWLRLAAGGATLLVWWLGSRRLAEPARAFTLLGLSAGYLMLFNPRTESNSYVILAPILAVVAARALAVGGSWTNWLPAGMALALGNASMGNPIWPWTKLWLKPVVALVFMGYLCYESLRAAPSMPGCQGESGEERDH